MSSPIEDVDIDAVSLDVDEHNGKLTAPVEQLTPWEDNPRDADDVELERLQEHLESLGQYKPLLVAVDSPDVPDGTVIGGNMRISAMSEMGWERAWVSLLSPDEYTSLVEYALSDNDRAGYYDEDELAGLVRETDELDVTKFKVDFYKPVDTAQNLAAGTTAEDMLAKEGIDLSTPDESGIDRSLDGIDTDRSTAMVQLVMGKGDLDQFTQHVQELKTAYGVETTTDVAQRAIENQFAQIADDYPESPDAKSRVDGGSD